MRKDEYVLTKELRRLEKYGLVLQAKRIGVFGDGGYKYDILFTDDKRVLEPGCDVSEILGIINSVETCIELYANRCGSEPVIKNEQSSNTMPKGTDLFSRLKRLRLEFARTERVPAFVIFTDRTLLEMCEKTPTDEVEMLEINGVGPKKLEKYGSAFIKIISEYKNTKRK
ncbi:HRDC domain-containing protein [Butyrivibrio sp. Su6]|uniref:HRDC domain-containing protein n=1 Tax=Butyrivibrio sp. Su6 TaxID=1520810 RepID=UPI00089E23E6|nr:HRDC domain-containing protein [Butyrivibrio sp. Su6]SEF61922.1 HRDC domain-containing protein [Butyrivibrio sp. Su6]